MTKLSNYSGSILLSIRIKFHMLMTMSKVIACGGVNHFHRTYKNGLNQMEMTLHEKTAKENACTVVTSCKSHEIC